MRRGRVEVPALTSSNGNRTRSRSSSVPAGENLKWPSRKLFDRCRSARHKLTREVAFETSCHNAGRCRAHSASGHALENTWDWRISPTRRSNISRRSSTSASDGRTIRRAEATSCSLASPGAARRSVSVDPPLQPGSRSPHETSAAQRDPRGGVRRRSCRTDARMTFIDLPGTKSNIAGEATSSPRQTSPLVCRLNAAKRRMLASFMVQQTSEAES